VGVRSPKLEVKRASMMAASTLIQTAPARIAESEFAVFLQTAREVLSNREKCEEALVDAAVALWCTIVRMVGVEVEGAELMAVLEQIPTEEECVALVDQLRFILYAVERWPGAVTELEAYGLRLFRTIELIFRLLTPEEIAFFGRHLKSAGEAEITRISPEGTEHGLRLAQERLAALPA
jgi:hypothetical protein